MYTETNTMPYSGLPIEFRKWNNAPFIFLELFIIILGISRLELKDGPFKGIGGRVQA